MRRENDDEFKVLGIEPTTNMDEIRRAYKKQALLNHPDKGGSKEAFIKATEAYEKLRDKAIAGSFQPNAGEEVDVSGVKISVRDTKNYSQYRPNKIVDLFEVALVDLKKGRHGTEVSNFLKLAHLVASSNQPEFKTFIELEGLYGALRTLAGETKDPKLAEAIQFIEVNVRRTVNLRTNIINEWKEAATILGCYPLPTEGHQMSDRNIAVASPDLNDFQAGRTIDLKKGTMTGISDADLYGATKMFKPQENVISLQERSFAELDQMSKTGKVAYHAKDYKKQEKLTLTGPVEEKSSKGIFGGFFSRNESNKEEKRTIVLEGAMIPEIYKKASETVNINQWNNNIIAPTQLYPRKMHEALKAVGVNLETNQVRNNGVSGFQITATPSQVETLEKKCGIKIPPPGNTTALTIKKA